MKENAYQSKLIKEIKRRLPNAIVMKNDPNYIQGMSDLTILHNDRWATLEVKASEKSTHRPNQDYYVDKMNSMSFSSFIYPENEKRVLGEMEAYLDPGRMENHKR